MSDQMFATLCARGVTWGEFAVNTLEELLEMDIKPVVKNVKVKRVEKVKKVSKLVATLAKLSKPKRVKDVKDVKEVKCLCCDYKVHPNPPNHFTAEQRNHCCGWCQMTNGREHGGHCMR